MRERAVNKIFHPAYMLRCYCVCMQEERDMVELRSGAYMPQIGLGTWQLRNTAQTIVDALRMGYQMIDTSGDYGTQPGIGEGLRRSGLAREDFYLVTKVEEDEDAYAAALNNLRELRLGYANLLLIHRPPARGAGVELWRALCQAQADGLTVDIGVSNYSTNLIDELIEATGEVPAVNQIEWSPFGYSDEMLNYCKEKRIVIQAYSPLTRTHRLRERELREIGFKYGKSPAQILLRWDMQLGVVPLPKANQRAHLEENLNVFDFELSESDMATLKVFNEEYSSLGSLAYV